MEYNSMPGDSTFIPDLSKVSEQLSSLIVKMDEQRTPKDPEHPTDPHPSMQFVSGKQVHEYRDALTRTVSDINNLPAGVEDVPSAQEHIRTHIVEDERRKLTRTLNGLTDRLESDYLNANTSSEHERITAAHYAVAAAADMYGAGLDVSKSESELQQERRLKVETDISLLADRLSTEDINSPSSIALYEAGGHLSHPVQEEGTLLDPKGTAQNLREIIAVLESIPGLSSAMKPVVEDASILLREDAYAYELIDRRATLAVARREVEHKEESLNILAEALLNVSQAEDAPANVRSQMVVVERINNINILRQELVGEAATPREAEVIGVLFPLRAMWDRFDALYKENIALASIPMHTMPLEQIQKAAAQESIEKSVILSEDDKRSLIKAVERLAEPSSLLEGPQSSALEDQPKAFSRANSNIVLEYGTLMNHGE